FSRGPLFVCSSHAVFFVVTPGLWQRISLCCTANLILHSVTVETGLSPRSPVRSRIVLFLQTSPHEAVKALLQRMYHDADVPGPDNQVTGMRESHSHKIVVPTVEFERTRVGILKPRIQVNLVDQVRAVRCFICWLLFLPRGIHNGASFFDRQQAC